MTDLARLHRVRTGARATLALGIGASLAANILAAHPSIPGRVIAAWSPVALLVTVELLTRVPIGAGWLSRLHGIAAAAIAGIAAWVSYWHMVEVALRYGEAPVAAHLLPVSVDGLVVVASVCLVEITQRLNAEQVPVEPAVVTKPQPAPTPQPVPRPTPVKAPAKPTVDTNLRDLVRSLATTNPEWTQTEVAEHANCSVRTVRRHLTPPPPALSAVPALLTPTTDPQEASA